MKKDRRPYNLHHQLYTLNPAPYTSTRNPSPYTKARHPPGVFRAGPRLSSLGSRVSDFGFGVQILEVGVKG